MNRIIGRNNSWRVAFLLLISLLCLAAMGSAPLPRSLAAAQAARLTLSQTVKAEYSRATSWTISSYVDPGSWVLAYEDEAVSRYTVVLERAGTKDSGWTVSGTLHIENQTAYAATVTGVDETLSSKRKAAVTCPLALPAVLQPGQSLDCAYLVRLSKAARGIVTAVVKTKGRVPGAASRAAYAFQTPQAVNSSVTVRAGGQVYGPFTGSTSFTFDRLYNCSNSAAPQVETAVIQETGQSTQSSVTINCPLGPGIQYERSDQTYRDGSGWEVKGTLTLHQATNRMMWVTGVHEVIGDSSGSFDAAVTCDHDFSTGAFALPPGVVLHCTYQAPLPDQSQRWAYTVYTFQVSRWYPDGTRAAVRTWDVIDHPTTLMFNP